MKLKHTLLLAATISITLSINTTKAQSLAVEQQIKPSIAFMKAAKIALSNANGRLVALEVDHFDKSPIYVAELITDKSHTMMRIDGNSGKVLATEKISATSAQNLHAMLEERDHNGHDDGDDHNDHQQHDDNH